MKRKKAETVKRVFRAKLGSVKLPEVPNMGLNFGKLKIKRMRRVGDATSEMINNR